MKKTKKLSLDRQAVRELTTDALGDTTGGVELERKETPALPVYRTYRVVF